MDELTGPGHQNSWVQKRKTWQNPQGFGGFCFNMRVPPFNSLNVRKASAHLFSREKLFEVHVLPVRIHRQLLPGPDLDGPNAERVRYDPETARSELAADGWVQRDAEGYLANEQGERFPSLTLDLSGPGLLRHFTVVKDDLWQQAGIKLEIKLVDGATHLKNMWEYKFSMIYTGWTALALPDMEAEFASKYADKPQTNNLNGYKNAEVDQLIEAYKYEFNAAKRREMLQRMDTILFEEYPYALGWYALLPGALLG